jgi:ABC-type oligopeptide transport system substrate-binding subunit
VLALVVLLAGLESSNDPTIGLFASYGAAAPVLIIGYALMRKTNNDADKRVAAAEARADKSEKRAEDLTERLLSQQATMIPVLTEATAVIRATAPR